MILPVMHRMEGTEDRLTGEHLGLDAALCKLQDNRQEETK